MAKSFDITVKNLPQTVRLVRRVGEKAIPALKSELNRELETVIAEAVRHHVPVDLGALRGSKFVHDVSSSSSRVAFEGGFGGVSAPYALIVHERTDVHHTVGNAKYLERPFNEALVGMDDRIAAGIRVRVPEAR